MADPGLWAPLPRVLSGAVESVIIEGHTDDRPIQTAAFPSNWELSGARASSVVRFFLEQDTALEPQKYIAVGYGEHHPKQPNLTAEGRAKNRRVELLFRWKSWDNPERQRAGRLPDQTAL